MAALIEQHSIRYYDVLSMIGTRTLETLKKN